jgi:phospholipid transport system substrate-binding protein
LLGLAVSLVATLARADDPRSVVSSLHAALVETATAVPPLTLEARYERLVPVVAATHDLEYIAELTIRRQWQGFDADERERFTAAFTRLSAMTYASRFDAVDNDTFRILNVSDTSAPRVQVDAEIVRGEERNIPLQYTLEDRGAGWRIVNIFADGVSDLALRRAEYQRILADGTLDDLLAHIESQTTALE